MSFNLIAFQDLVEQHVRSQFPAYEVYDETVLDDEEIAKFQGKFRPFIVLRHSGMLRSTAQTSFAGVRKDEYIGGFDLMVVAPSPSQAKIAIAMMQDDLIGWKLPNGSYLTPEGCAASLVVPDFNGRPHVYLSMVGFSYRINENDPISYSGS